MRNRTIVLFSAVITIAALCTGCSDKPAESLKPEGPPNPNVPSINMGGAGGPGGAPAVPAAPKSASGPASN